MDLRELESFRLEDAVKFHDSLNPQIWGPDEHMLPAVRERLLAIADDFRESLGIDVEVKDITISGSNAAYTYTPHSDIDLHLVTDLPQADASDVYRELFDAKKYQYNDEHDFRIGPYDVELYVQDASKPHYSQGIYSIQNDEWISVPKRRKPEVNDISVRSKYEDMGARIDAAIESGDLSRMDALAKKIRLMRQTGLETTGEFGPENLAFKVLRNNGTLNKLKQARLAAKDREMSLNERKKKRGGKKKKWGVFGGYYYPGFGYYGSGSPEGSADGGGGDGGGESVRESREMDLGTLLKDFVKFCSTQLGLEDAPRIRIKRDPQWSRANNTFGRYVPEEHTLYLSVANRHPLDIMRTMAHELTHHRQAEVEPMPDHAGETGSKFENQANAIAGIIMRKWADLHPDMFDQPITENGGDEDTGDFPNQSGGKMPGEPIPYPKGTVKVDVSDVYDWYKLGQHISDLKGLGHHDFGKGPPQTVLSFGSEPVEHKYIQDLAKLGLTTTDIDESLRGKLGAAAAAACIAGTPGCATTDISATDALRGVQAVGRAVQTTKPYGTATRAEIIRSAAQEEFAQAIKDWIRNGRQGPQPKPPPALVDQWRDDVRREMAREADEPLAKLDDPIVNWDIPYSAIARPERLYTARRFGRISHYGSAGASSAIISVPVSKERAFVDTMRNLAIPVKKSAVYEASGYIPTDAEKDDPRFKMALTVDVKPGQTGKEANKLGLKTDSQGRPQLLMKRLANLLAETKLDEKCWTGYRKQGMKKKGDRRVPNCVPVNEEEDLLEVKMSPGELRKWAESPEAEGIRAGFEAEMIFRDTSDGGSDDYEPDYEMDERARDIDEVLDFFRGGDEGISGGMANRLRESLYEEYIEWRESQIYNEWETQVEEQVRDWMETNVWGDDGTQDQYRERAAEQLGIETSEQSADQAEEIEKRARELFDADVEQSIEDEDSNYEDAREYFRDMMADSDDFDQTDWFRDSYPYMSDVADGFGLDWPYWTGGRQGNGSRSVEDIAQSLQYAIDMPVVGSSNYHGTTRRPGRWIIEPDGSLDPDEPDDEQGLEIVSPPMPLPETLRKLQQVIDWANGDGDAYTNSSTGLHMGISIPHKGGAVDYVKLVLFMGDQYVLDKFGRMANSYCASALGKLRDIQSQRRSSMTEAEAARQTDKTAAAMDLMRKNLIELAEQLVRDGVGSSKYTSAHMKDDYIEFRSPGGDYLSLDSREDQALEDTMLRFARAMYIAGRPDVERREYAKKLYRLIDPQNDEALRLFLDYNTGRINREELKKQWAEQVLAKEAPPPSRGKAKEYEVVRTDTGEVIDTIEDWNPDSAMETALLKWSGKGFDFSVREKPEGTRAWEVVNTRTGEIMGRIDIDSMSDAREEAIERYGDPAENTWQMRSTTLPAKPASRRAQVAKKIRERPSIWRVTDTNTNKTILVAASDTRSAKFQAADSGGEHWRSLRANDPDAMLVEPATAQEVRQYMVQQADNEKDSEQVQQRVQGTHGLFPYRVRWTERRNGQEVEDSMSVSGRNADAAMAAVRHALEVQGRDVISIDAEPNPSQGYQQGRSQQDQGEFTGRWQIRDALSGDVLHTISGIGNNQGDANRHARQWIESTGYGGAYEIVPEMS